MTPGAQGAARFSRGWCGSDKPIRRGANRRGGIKPHGVTTDTASQGKILRPTGRRSLEHVTGGWVCDELKR
jgi:hypothetical protein